MGKSKKAPVMWTNDQGQTLAFDCEINIKDGLILLKNKELRFVKDFERWFDEQSLLQLKPF